MHGKMKLLDSQQQKNSKNKTVLTVSEDVPTTCGETSAEEIVCSDSEWVYPVDWDDRSGVDREG